MHKIDSSTKSKCENQHMVPSEVPTTVFINKSNIKKAAILMHQIKGQIPCHITPHKHTHTHTPSFPPHSSVRLNNTDQTTKKIFLPIYLLVCF